MREDFHKIKLLLVTNLFPNSMEPNRGIFTYQIVKELREWCDVTVIAPIPWFPQTKLLKYFTNWYQLSKIPKYERIDGIEVYHPRYVVIPKISGFMCGFSMYFPLRNLIKQLHQQRRFDVINAHWIFPDGFATTLVANKIGIPVIVSALGCDINLYINFRLRKPQLLYTLRKAGLISTVSMALRDRIIELGISPEKIRCIYNGVDTEIFFPKDQKECRKKLSLNEDGKIVIFVGGMVPVKSVEYLIQAFNLLHMNGKEDYRLILVGDGILRGSLEKQAQELISKQKITFVGKKPHQEISDWLNASDLLCLPSIREGHPNVVIEALACGRPVVASKVGGIPELINDENGILVEPRNPDELAKAIDQALNRLWITKRIVSNIQRISWQACAEHFISAYETLINSRILHRE